MKECTPLKVQNMVFTRIQDGKIKEGWVQPDMLGLMLQLGAVEPPSATKQDA